MANQGLEPAKPKGNVFLCGLQISLKISSHRYKRERKLCGRMRRMCRSGIKVEECFCSVLIAHFSWRHKPRVQEFSRLDKAEGKNLQIKISTSFLSSFLFDPGPTPKWKMKGRSLKCQAQCSSRLG